MLRVDIVFSNLFFLGTHKILNHMGLKVASSSRFVLVSSLQDKFCFIFLLIWTYPCGTFREFSATGPAIPGLLDFKNSHPLQILGFTAENLRKFCIYILFFSPHSLCNSNNAIYSQRILLACPFFWGLHWKKLP